MIKFDADNGIISYVKKRIASTPNVEIYLERLTMQDEHITKLTEERNDLYMKIERLKRFMKSDEFETLEGPIQEMLSLQKTQMKALLKTLDMRIDWENC